MKKQDSQKAINTKQKIMNSAILLFANKGFENTTTREICQSAEVNLSMISYYFKTKEGLYTTIIESIVDYGLSNLNEEFEKVKTIDEYTREQKIDLYKTLLEKFVKVLYSEIVPSSFVILMIKEQTNNHSRFTDMYAKKINRLYISLRKVLASILGKKETSKEIIFQVSNVVAQILSMKIMDRANLSALAQQEYNADDKKRLTSIILSHVENHIKELY